jgi:hypothetical protein
MIVLNHWDGFNLITVFGSTIIDTLFSMQIMFVDFHYWRFDVSCGIGFTNCTKEAPCNEVKEAGKGQALRMFAPHNLDRFP